MTPLHGLRVAEIGERIGVTLTGRLLASFGADVVIARPSAPRPHKWRNPAAACAGKRLVDEAAMHDELAAADIVLLSSDLTRVPQWTRGAGQIVCDITAHGAGSPDAGRPDTDVIVQALTGLIDTTGDAEAPPVPNGFPILEGLASFFATAGVLAALRVRARSGKGQDVAVALHDCGVATLHSFLPLHIVGQKISRIGNRHALAAPWNAYQASDGSLIICTVTDEQWRKLVAALGAPELGNDPRFATQRARMADIATLDQAVAALTARMNVAQIVAGLEQAGIPCAPVTPVAALPTEPNLVHRGSIKTATDPITGAQIPIVARWMLARGCGAARPDKAAADALPLAGVRVIEIGQYTTAPVATRHLAALGAEVLKIEPPAGDPIRPWAPNQDGQGYFFALNNTGKRSLMLDLRTKTDMTRLRGLLVEADVLIENLKPGSLERLGLGIAALKDINPHLVMCAVSGFGASSAYPGRPAFDTVVQAMSGVMDSCRAQGVPFKTGISICDISGGLAGLVAVLAGLMEGGAELDVSMQDVGAWLSHFEWAATPHPTRVEANGAGYDVIEAGRTAPVCPVGDVLTDAASSGMLTEGTDGIDRNWPILRSPIGLSLTPPILGQPIGPLGEANESPWRKA